MFLGGTELNSALDAVLSSVFFRVFAFSGRQDLMLALIIFDQPTMPPAPNPGDLILRRLHGSE